MAQRDPSHHSTASIVGNTPAISALRAQIHHLASFDTIGNPHIPTVLLYGETGTGKGLVAQAIHDSGPRAQKPFINVNCAAIPETLLEAELFGFEAGAFTDAKRAKPGLFEAASAGTLFLDEIEALPMPLQGKFLKAIEEKRVRRLGAVSEHQVDVKLIAATQQDLNRRVSEGHFRADLYHRLAVVVLEVPPLRERGEDIILLAQHYLRHYAEAHGLIPRRLSDAAEAWLLSYGWPGNVRELSHLMERVILLSQEAIIDTHTLERMCLSQLPTAAVEPVPVQEDGGPLDEPARIRQVLNQTGGNVMRAARLLGLSRNALRYRIRQYGIERPSWEDQRTVGVTAPSVSEEKKPTPLPETDSGRSPNVDPQVRVRTWEQRPVATFQGKATVGSGLGTFRSSRLVGRKTEMSFLQERLDATLQGKGSVVFITGQAGIGKTRLAREARDHAIQRGCQWLEGKYERAVSHPYKAWTEVVRSYLHQSEARSLQSLAGPYAAHLAKIVPEVAGGLEGPAEAVRSDPESERLLLFEGLTQFFIHVSQEAPLVLFLDDLQWAPSIELLHHLSQNIGNQRLLTLAAYRDDELKENPGLWRTVLAMNRNRLFHPLPVNPLEEKEVEQMVSQRVEGASDSQLVEVVYHKTEGNPFFVEELLRLLQERKAIVHTEAGWQLKEPGSLETPESVKAVINEHLERLGKDAEELLRMASVIGREFPLGLLRELVDQSEETLIEVMDRCERAGLIDSKQVPGEEMYSFTHDLMQEALYESIGSARRRRHHLRTGQAIEKLYGTRLEARYDALAHHFFEGNSLEKAAEYGELAARRAISVHSYGKAVRLLEQTLDVQSALDPDDRAKRCDLLLTLGSALGPAGEPKRVADVVAPEALKLAEAVDDRQRASQCCQMALEGLYRYGGPPITRSPAWRQWAERASHYAAPDTKQQVIADLALSLVYLAQRRWAEYRKLTVRAGELARKLNEPEVLFRAICALMMPMHAVQHDPERLSLAEEFMRVPRDGVSTSTLRFFLRASAGIFLAAGERSRAEDVWRESNELAYRTRDADVLLWPLLAEAHQANLNGDLEHAAVARTRISNRADELGIAASGRLSAQHLSFRPLLYLGRGEEALADLPEAERLVGSQAFSSIVRFGWNTLCLAHMGRLAEAQAQLSEYLGQLNLSPEEDETPAPILINLLEIAVLVEDRQAISVLAKRLTGTVVLSNSEFILANLGRYLGRAATLLRDWTEARANYERALDRATKIQHRPEVALTRFELAQLLLSEAEDATGSHSAATLRSEAQAHLDFAIEEFRAMKMQPALERALRKKGLLTA